DALINRLFIEVLLGLGFPERDLPFLKELQKYYLPDDEKRMKFIPDFIGIQNYTRLKVRASLFVPMMWGELIEAKKITNQITDMGWEVYPEGIYHILKKFSQYENVKKIYITENGAAFPDKLENHNGEIRIQDTQRIDYIRSYLEQVLRAKKEGVPVEGYFIWSFMDNFEWAEGYRPRFGLVYVD
ncbi:MAG: family 1 glycosylhydrolase, partial [Bacteroidia bacterium]|nr:family 1 glycosylhydrolase [Bacteroidia bacterium]